MKRVLGIDIGGTNTKLALITEKGDLLGERVCATPAGRDELVDISYIEPVVEALLAETGCAIEGLHGIGIGMPMLLDGNENITRCFNVLMDNARMKEALYRIFGGKPLHLVNDANAALLGECWRGAAARRASAIMVTLGTGVGGAVMVEGRLIAGAHGAAGEFGHMQVRGDETETCVCGRRGCLEQYISAKGLVHQAYRELDRTEERTLLDGNGLSPARIFEAAHLGDEVARRLVSAFACDMARAFAELAVITDPEVFIIGGGLSYHHEAYLEEMRAAYREEALSSCRDIPILVAALGNRAGVYGAASLVL